MSDRKAKEKGKGVKASTSNTPSKTSFKTITMTPASQVKKQKLDETPKEEKLRDDAYQLALEASHPGEYIFPYIPASTKWVIPIESKYMNLQPNEVAAFYFKNNADSFVYPKDYQYFQDILVATSSVEFDNTERSGGEIAYSKAIIHRVIKPEQWSGDLFKPYEMTRQLRYKNITIKFNYFDYINAWEHAFYYENRQRKFSWWIQFSNNFGKPELPNWFIVWYTQWGLYPICMPDKVRSIYEDFNETNKSLLNPSLWFTILYQVPWIVRWEAIIQQRSLNKLGEGFKIIPYIGRRILIKWWPKFNFFENSVFATKGLIDLEPPKPPKQNISELYREFTSKIPKEDLSKLIELLRQEEDSASSKMSEDEDKTIDLTRDDLMEDSQDPFA